MKRSSHVEIDQDAPASDGDGKPATTITSKAKQLAALAEKLANGGELTAEEKAFIEAHDKSRWAKSVDAIAKHFHVSARAVLRWIDRAPEVFTKSANGRYDLRALEDWRRADVLTNKKGRVTEWDAEDAGASAAGMTLPQLRTEKERAVVIKTWLQIDILRAKYADVDLVKSQVQGVFARAKARIKRLPRELCYAVTGITPAQAEQLLDGETDNILNDLCEAITGMEKELERPAVEETGERHLQHSPRADVPRKARPY
jgi:hypothetical protein